MKYISILRTIGLAALLAGTSCSEKETPAAPAQEIVREKCSGPRVEQLVVDKVHRYYRIAKEDIEGGECGKARKNIEEAAKYADENCQPDLQTEGEKGLVSHLQDTIQEYILLKGNDAIITCFDLLGSLEKEPSGKTKELAETMVDSYLTDEKHLLEYLSAEEREPMMDRARYVAGRYGINCKPKAERLVRIAFYNAAGRASGQRDIPNINAVMKPVKAANQIAAKFDLVTGTDGIKQVASVFYHESLASIRRTDCSRANSYLQGAREIIDQYSQLSNMDDKAKKQFAGTFRGEQESRLVDAFYDAANEAAQRRSIPVLFSGCIDTGGKLADKYETDASARVEELLGSVYDAAENSLDLAELFGKNQRLKGHLYSAEEYLNLTKSLEPGEKLSERGKKLDQRLSQISNEGKSK